MNIILLLTLISLFFVFLSTGIVLLWKYQRYLSADIFFILLGILGLFLFDHICNIFEWSGMKSEMDMYGDFFQILQPMFLGILVYALLQHRLRRQILISEAKYRLLVENQNDLVIKLDPDGHLLFVSPSYTRLFGSTEKELLGQSFLPVVHKDDQEMTRKEIEKLSRPPYACQFRQRAHTKFGWRHLAWAYRAIFNESGKIHSIVGTGRDITDQAQAEEERTALLSKLETKNKELQSLLYISSHDLQSPLVNIRGFSGELKNTCEQLKDMLSNAAPDPDKKKIAPLLDEIDQALYFIDTGAEKMQDLIDGILKLSRIGSVELTIQPINMKAMIHSITETLHFQIQQSGTEVVIEELPECNTDLYQISQVFSNLIENALKFLDPARPGQIRITGHKKDGQCEYHITDNGIGIKPEHQSKIFEIFHRLNPEGSVKGLGLGLSIVLRILDKLDGSIRLLSEPGKGSTFIVTLPAAPKEVAS